MRHLDGKIGTNQVKPGDLDEQVQGLVQEIQSTQQDVEDGKPLDAEMLIAFEAIIVAVENATQTRQEEITRLALELDHARKEQQEANERQSRHEVVSSQLHANIMGQGETSANRANALEQEVIKLWAQYAADVATLQQVVNGHADSQERVTGKLFAQMTTYNAKIGQLPINPYHYYPGSSTYTSSRSPTSSYQPRSSTTIGTRETGAKCERTRQARQRKTAGRRTAKTRKPGRWKPRSTPPSTIQ